MVTLYYDFAKFKDKTVKRTKLTNRSKIESILKIKYRLKVDANSYLHVGSGLATKVNGKPCMETIRNGAGIPIIPGATIKGLTRNNFETIIKGCCFVGIRGGLFESCDFINSKKRAKKFSDFVACRACDLFGLQSVSSRIFLNDAIKISNHETLPIKIPKLMGPKRFIKDGKKFYRNIEFRPSNANKEWIEVLPGGTTFEGTISIINPKVPFELQAILLCFLEFFYKGRTNLIGHGKNLGLGRCKMELIQEDPILLGTAKDQTLTNPQPMNEQEYGTLTDMSKISPSNFRIEVIEKIQKSKGVPYPGRL